jgi:hypothetical protein
MVATAVGGIDLFKIMGCSVSRWIPSLKTGTAFQVRQPFYSQIQVAYDGGNHGSIWNMESLWRE